MSIAVFFLLLFLTPALAEILTLTITGDTRPIIIFETFGFTPRGSVSISISSVSFSSSLTPPDPSLFGFFLLSDDNLIQESIFQSQNPNPNLCVLSSPYIRLLFTFRDLAPDSSSYNNSFPINLPDEYTLFFANCVPESQVSMSIRTEMFNARSDGSRDYLSIGQAPVPSSYFIFFLAYSLFFTTWIYLCVFKNRILTHRIHYLMAGLLLTKAMCLLFAAEDQHYVRNTGTPHGWDVLFLSVSVLERSAAVHCDCFNWEWVVVLEAVSAGAGEGEEGVDGGDSALKLLIIFRIGVLGTRCYCYFWRLFGRYGC